MGERLQCLKLAAVQAASVHLDRDASVDKACDLILEAGRAGASVIGFPEGFIPAHPSWFTVQPTTGRVSLELSKQLFQNAIVIPSESTAQLSEACRTANITAVIGVCEKRPDTTGTMFNTQIFIGPDGRILGKHQKIMPTVGERIVHASGGGDTLKAVDTSFGKISGLICGENANPLAVYTLMCAYPVVHVASWPSFVSPALSLSDLVMGVSRGVAYSMGSFVINATGVLTDEMIKAYAPNCEQREFLEGHLGIGYASIIGPTGKVIASSDVRGECLVYADVDLNDVMIPKIINDFAGHYNRPDIFSLTVNETVPPALSRGLDRSTGDASLISDMNGESLNFYKASM